MLLRHPKGDANGRERRQPSPQDAPSMCRRRNRAARVALEPSRTRRERGIQGRKQAVSLGHPRGDANGRERRQQATLFCSLVIQTCYHRLDDKAEGHR